MSEIMNIFSPPSAPDIPVVKKAEPPPKETSEEVTTAKRDFLSKQALLSAKNSTIATNPLGVASDILQTNRKQLLGG
jgi:hypothetical protein